MNIVVDFKIVKYNSYFLFDWSFLIPVLEFFPLFLAIRDPGTPHLCGNISKTPIVKL